MKPENKIPVLTRLSDEMTAVVNFQQPGLPPWPADGDIETQRQYYLLERRFWNADAPSMTTRTCAVPTPYGDVTTRLYSPQPTSQATLYYLHGGGFILGNLDTHDRIMRLLARYTGCTVIGIDYSLSPQARYPQAIEETVAVCSYFSQHADEYSLNVEKSVSPEIPQAPCWRLPARSGYVISTFAAVTLSRFCCGMGCMGCKIR